MDRLAGGDGDDYIKAGSEMTLFLAGNGNTPLRSKGTTASSGG